MIGPNFAPHFFAGRGSSSSSPSESEFLPSDIAGLSIWYRADDGAFSDNFVSSPPGTPCVNNSNLVSWENSSNSSLNAYGFSSVEPTFKTNIQNSLPSIRFNGTDEYLVDEAVDGWSSGSNLPFTLFFCFNASNTGGIRTLMNMQSDLVPDNKLKFLTVLNDGTLSTSRQCDDGAGERTLSSAASQITNGTSYVVCVHYNGTTATIYKNGNSVASSNLGVDGEILQYIGSANKIGASGDGTIANYLSGDLFEIVGYESALSNANFLLVNGYLGAKWGINVTPSTFNPDTDVNGLITWYSATSSVYSDNYILSPPGTPAVNLDHVDTIADLNTPATDYAVNSLVQGPVYRTNIQNSLPALRFNGTDEFITTTTSDYISTLGDTANKAFTVVACLKPTSNTLDRPVIAAGNTLDSSKALIPIQIESDGAISSSRNVGVGGTRTVTTAAAEISDGTTYVLASRYTGSAITIFKNGTLASVSGSIGTDSAAASFNQGGLGCHIFGLSLTIFSGDIFEVIIYNSALTAIDRNYVIGYLGTKWGVTVA